MRRVLNLRSRCAELDGRCRHECIDAPDRWHLQSRVIHLVRFIPAEWPDPSQSRPRLMAERNHKKPKAVGERTGAGTRSKVAAVPKPGQAKPPAKPTSPRATSATTSPATRALPAALARLEEQVADLMTERDGLAAELALARAEIVALEAARTDAINRIDWVLDSLQSLLQSKP
jgi:hypothetical protein